jgi:hypothetical protein
VPQQQEKNGHVGGFANWGVILGMPTVWLNIPFVRRPSFVREPAAGNIARTRLVPGEMKKANDGRISRPALCLRRSTIFHDPRAGPSTRLTSWRA